VALNIGSINFGLGVNTRGLTKSLIEIVKFGHAVEQASRRTGKGVKTVAADLRRQEKAALNAVQQILQLQHQLSKANAPPAMFASSARALRELTQELTKGRLTALEYQRALEKFQADLGRSRRELDNYIRSAKEGVTPTERLAVKLRNLSSSATIALGPLSGLGSRINAFASIATRTNVAVAGMVGGIIAGSVALARMGQNAVTTAQELNHIRARFDIVSGPAFATADFERVRQIAEAAGAEFVSTANAFTRLQAAAQGTALQGEEVARIFEDIVFGAARFQLTADELAGTLKAFEQMISKGIVQAEELRGQLGDRLVGAFNIAAQAMGVTTRELNDMLRAGDVVTADFLPKFAAAFREALGTDQIERVETFRATMNRLTNAQAHFFDQLDRTFGISRAYQAAVQSLTSTLNFLADNMETVATAAAMVSGALLALVAPTILQGLVLLAGLIKKVGLAVAGLNAVAMANPIGALATVLARLALMAGGAAAGYYMMSKGAEAAATETGELIDRINEFIEADRRASVTRRQQARALIDELQAQMNAVEARMQRLQNFNVFGMPHLDTDSLSTSQGFFETLVNEARRIWALTTGNAVSVETSRVLEINNLREEYEALVQAMEALLALEERLRAEEEAQQAAGQEAANRRVLGAQRQIARILAEATATRGLAGEVERLQAIYRDVDAIKQFREGLRELTEDQRTINELTAQYAAALSALRQANAQTAVDDANKQIDRMRLTYAAMAEGPEAVEALNKAFQDADAVEEFGARLRARGVDLARVAVLTELFAFWQQKLNEQQEEAIRLARDQNVTKAFENANREIASMQRLLDAFDAGGLIGLEKQQDIESITRQVEALRQSFIDAGAAADDPRIAATLEQYANLLETLARTREPAALAEAQRQIERISAEAAATRGLAGEVERLQAQFRDVDAIEQFRERLSSVVQNQEVVNELVSQFASALGALQQANAQNAVDDITRQIDRMRLTYEAMKEGPEAVEALNRAFQDADAIEQHRARLVAAGVSLEEAINLTELLTFWQQKLNEQQEEANRLARKQNIAKAFKDANREIASMQRLLDAFNVGGLAGLEKQQDIESITRQVEALRQSFISAGAAADDPRIAAALEQYANLLEALENARRQAALEQALNDYAREMDNLGRRIAAARISAEALANVDAAIAIEEQVEQMRQALVAAGNEAEVAAEKARAYGEALALLHRLMERFNTSADSTPARLQDIQQALAEVQAQALASSLDRNIDRQTRMIQAVASFTRLVAESGIKGARASQMIRAYAEALVQIDTAEARRQIDDILDTLREYQDELAAMQQGPDFYKAFTESRGAISAIIQFRDSLRAAGVSISDTNRLTRELVRTLNELERQRAANRLQEAFADADKELEVMQRRIDAMRRGPQALARLDAQLDIERRVEEFRRRLQEAAASQQLLENAFDLPETIATTEAAADKLRIALERIGHLSGLDAGVLELITSLDEAIERVGILSGDLSNMGAVSVAPANLTATPQAATSALTSLTGEQSRLVTPDAGRNMSALLDNQFRRMQEIFGQPITITDAIARAGTSREIQTPNSQHFYGRALDLSLQGMDNATRIRLVQAALAAGFTGFGFGENILHVDIGPRRSWAYGNTEFAGRPVAEMRQMVSGAGAASSSNIAVVPTALSPEEIDRRVAAYRAGLEAMAAAERAYTQGTALASAQERIDRLRAEVEAYRQGAAAVEALQAQYARLDEIRDFRKSLEEAGIAQEVVNEKVREFQALLEERDALRNRIDAFKEFIDVVDNQLVSALDGVSKAFADVVVSGEGLSSLADLGRQVASEILSAFLKLYVLKPLLEDIFPGTYGAANTNAAPGQVTTSGGGGFFGVITNALAGLFGTIFSRKGNVFREGILQDVRMYRRGGILSGPTLFTTAGGPAIGGEAGDEAIVPLVRDSSGNLGIRAIGASRTTVVNFNFPPGTDVTAFRKSEAQLAAMASRVVSRGIGSL
jgi:tape measure domain-containing protein